MGDDATSTESAATTLTEGTAPPATAQGDGASSEATPTVAETEAASTEVDIWAKLSELDPDELIRRNPRLQGKVGSLAQQQAQRLASEIEQKNAARIAAQAEASRRAELRRLAEENPDALATRVVADLAQQEREERERASITRTTESLHQQLAQELNSFYDRAIVKEVWEHATPEMKQKLTWTNYNDIPSFLEAASDIISDYRAEKKSTTKAEELAKKRYEAMVKEAQLAAVKSDAESGTDLNLDSMSSGTKIFTRQEIRDMSLEEYRKHKTTIAAQRAAGLIK